MAVAIVGYRTYPDAVVEGKILDLENAMHEIQRAYPHLCKPAPAGPDHLGICIMGHSSGAHIALLMVVEHAQKLLENRRYIGVDPTTFVGISGVYDISHHFDYEAARGVEELSPLKPANGMTREAFRKNTPQKRLLNLLLPRQRESLDNVLPELLLVHGVEDTTAPFTSTAEAARVIKSCGVTKCNEIYLAKTGHEQTVFEMMLGGKTRDSILHWLLHRKERPSNRLHVDSKL